MSKDTDLIKDEMTIICEDGETRKVTALWHKKAPGLCITSANVFGEFDITHRKSSMTLIRGYERMWDAFLHMAGLQEKSIEHGFEWNLEKSELLAQKTFQESGIQSDITLSRHFIDFHQFPWEDQHPCDKAIEILDGLGLQTSDAEDSNNG